jgi:hypothetical protein
MTLPQFYKSADKITWILTDIINFGGAPNPKDPMWVQMVASDALAKYIDLMATVRNELARLAAENKKLQSGEVEF